MPSTLLFVPLDDRPCTRDFPVQLAPLAGWTLRHPPAAKLGTFTAAGNPPELLKWLDKHLRDAEGAILSVDMLVLGGLVASRTWDIDGETARTRLNTLAQTLGNGPRPIDVFSILMRVPPFCTSDRDRRLSNRLLQFSSMVARLGPHPSPIARLRLRASRRGIPSDFLRRYEATRERNHAINREVLTWARQGLVNYVLIGIDDSKTEGFNIRERDVLEPLLKPRHSDMLPGADEVALLLLARRALAEAKRRPRMAVHFSPCGLAQRVTRYEDRSVSDLLQAHARVVGIQLCEAGQHADIELFVNGPSHRQQEAATQITRPRPASRHVTFARSVAAAMAANKLVAVADLGFANGGDRSLLAALAEHVELPRLTAFAAWNTAGNTVGTVLAHAVLRWLQLRHPLRDVDAGQAEAAHQRFLLERFLDDTLYQSMIRNEVGVWLALKRVNVYALGEQHAAAEELVATRLQAAGHDFFTQQFRGRTIQHEQGKWRIEAPLHLTVHLPWPRLFEVAVHARFDLTPVRE